MDKIYLLIGNDTPLAVCLRKSEGEETPVPYDLSEARHLRLALVGHGMRVFAKDIEVSGEDDNVVSGMIPGRSLLKGDYDLEVTFNLDGRDKRFAVKDMFEAVDFLAEDADGEAEGEGAGIFVTVTVQPELIEISGPTGPQGPKGDTPVLSADEDGTIYADGVLLTEVVKDAAEQAIDAAREAEEAAETIDAKIAGKADESEVSQLRSEVEGVELLDFNTGALKAKYVDNSYVNKSNGAFAQYNGWSRTDYINVSLFSSVKITTTGAMTYNAFYDKDKAFIKAFSLVSGDNVLSIPDNAWYIVISSTTSTTKAVTFAIGEYRFTVLRDIGDRLIKLKFMASSGSLDTGEYGYRTDTKKIRYNNGTSVVDIPFYPGAVYNYENKLYIYNGDTIVPATNTKYSDSPIFESAIQELLISGYDAAWVNSITAFRFTAVAEGNIEYITLFAGSTSYSFRRVNDGTSGVLYFRRDSADTAEQGKGIYVLMNRAKFSTIRTNTPITLDAGMVLNLDTMPTIREYISGLTDGDVSFITPTLVANYKGIGPLGWIVDIANDAYYYTAPIQVSRGDIVLLEVNCTSSLVAIAKTDASGSKYIPIAIGKGSSDTKYRYVADENCYLAFTLKTDSLYSIRKVASPVYDAIKEATADAIFRDCAELYLAGDLSKAPTYADLMARYDALITAFPDMMTKTKIGESVNGQDIFEIKITKGAYNNAGRRGGTGRDAEIAKPKFMIASGTHGYEPGSPNALCLFVSELVKGHPALSAIRNNVELRIIPCVNPDGYDANTRTNANGVDINRNYNYNWTLHDEGTQNYGGPSAASEPETQAVQAWIDANTDAVFCLDWHQSSFNEEMSCLGGTTLVEATGQEAFKKMYLEAINGIAGMLISRRGVADNSIFAYAYNENGSVHGIFNGYLANKGVPGGCLEVPESVANSGNNSPLTISVAADVIGNLCKKAEGKYHI